MSIIADTIMATAIADRIREILATHQALAPIKAFIRGGAPVGGLPAHLYPFIEIYVARESTANELTGRITQINYSGSINVVEQMTDQVQQERQGDRFYRLPSYDRIQELTHEMVRVLSREENADLQELAATYQNLTETVTSFYIDGDREYGLDPKARTNNFDQFGSVPFLVETNRQEYTSTPASESVSGISVETGGEILGLEP